jgi:photosystem II stability/assembly factor-like uncharacterized protein
LTILKNNKIEEINMRNKKLFIVWLILLSVSISTSQNWRQIGSINQTISKIFFVSKTHGWILGTKDNIWHSSDGGFNWSLQYYTGSYGLSSIYFKDTLIGWASGANGRIIHTTNGGKTWAPQNSGTDYTLWDIRFFNHNLGWAVGIGGEYFSRGIILKTTNSGITWEKRSDSTINRLKTIFFLDSSYCWAVGGSNDALGPGFITFSSDGGTNWNEIKAPSWILQYIYFCNKNFGWIAGWNGALYKTYNNGLNWEHLYPENPPYFFEDFRGLAIADTSNIWVPCLNKIFHTIDGGKNWEKDTLSKNSVITDITLYNKESLWLITNDGKILKYYDETSSNNEKNILPTRLALYNIFPNPVNPSGNIRYDIPKSAFVTIKIYDLLGHELTTLVNGWKSVGTYTIEFNGSRYPSGIYFYRLTADDFTETKKLLLIK